MPPDLLPLADGGDGTLDALLVNLGGETVSARVQDPLGREIEAGYALVEDGGTALVEMATASGLSLVAEDERDAWAATTYGTGQLIADAVARGAQVIVAVAAPHHDGGAGARGDREGGRAPGARRRLTRQVSGGARARVFGPQKGADQDMVSASAAPHELRTVPNGPRGVPMTGAAGGPPAVCGRARRAPRAGAPWTSSDRLREASRRPAV